MSSPLWRWGFWPWGLLVIGLTVDLTGRGTIRSKTNQMVLNWRAGGPFGETRHGASFQIPDSQPPASHRGNWLGWGADVYNNRWASSDATVGSWNVDSLSIVCQKSFDPGLSAAPLVHGGIAYFPTFGGLLVALDYRTCQTVWTANITRIILEYRPLDPIQVGLVSTAARATPAMDGDVLFLGTLAHALLLAIDKRSGRLIDALQISEHPFAALTQSPTFYHGRIFQGVSSTEEAAPEVLANYQCCTFAGSMNAAELKHGRLRLLWTRPTIPAGLNISGASVWGSQPSIDPIRNLVFIATGNFYSVPRAQDACLAQTANLTAVREGLTDDPCLPSGVYSETVLALDITTGRINRATRLGALDAWNLACPVPGYPPPQSPAACPEFPGPDSDIGMAPTFVLGSEKTPHGLDVVVIGQKNSFLHALSAQAGRVLWSVPTGPTGIEGGLIWGMAVDDAAIYYNNVNSLRTNYTLPPAPGQAAGDVVSTRAFGAVRLRDGKVLWQVAAPGNATSLVSPAVVNDVVVTGTTGSFVPGAPLPAGAGNLTLVEKHSGKILSIKNLDAYFHGAPAVVHDYIMFGTGYGGLEPPY